MVGLRRRQQTNTVSPGVHEVLAPLARDSATPAFRLDSHKPRPNATTHPAQGQNESGGPIGVVGPRGHGPNSQLRRPGLNARSLSQPPSGGPDGVWSPVLQGAVKARSQASPLGHSYFSPLRDENSVYQPTYEPGAAGCSHLLPSPWNPQSTTLATSSPQTQRPGPACLGASAQAVPSPGTPLLGCCASPSGPSPTVPCEPQHPG